MDMNHLAVDVFQWAESVFPDRTDASMFLKMYKEMGELAEAETREEQEDEIADVLIMLLDFAKRKGVNPSLAVQRKLAINRTRQWRVTATGVMQHVKPGQE